MLALANSVLTVNPAQTCFANDCGATLSKSVSFMMMKWLNCDTNAILIDGFGMLRCAFCFAFDVCVTNTWQYYVLNYLLDSFKVIFTVYSLYLISESRTERESEREDSVGISCRCTVRRPSKSYRIPMKTIARKERSTRDSTDASECPCNCHTLVVASSSPLMQAMPRSAARVIPRTESNRRVVI